MGLKGFSLWAMGQMNSTCRAPPRELAAERAGHLGLALQVEFERQTLKPVFHLIGFRLWV
jgi:hypothetical protein